MRRISTSTGARAALGLFLLSACSDFSLAPAPQPPSPEGYIAGKTVQAVPGTFSYAPVPGAEVTILGTNLRVLAGTDGVFTVGPLPPGEYRVLLRHRDGDGKVRQKLVRNAAVEKGQTLPLGDVVLHDNAEVMGRALVVDGPTVGTLLFVPGTPYVALAGDDGRYVIRSLPEGVVRIMAWRDGFQPASTSDMELKGGVRTSATDLLLRKAPADLPPGGIEGSVYLPGRDEHSGVTITAIRSATEGGRNTHPTATSAADGGFRFEQLPAGLYRLKFVAEGLPAGELQNLLVLSGEQHRLEQPVVLAPADPSVANAPDGGFGPDEVDAGFDPDAGAPGDAGPGTGCFADSQCPSGRVCRDGQCLGCEFDSDCRAGQKCRAGLCVRGCTADAECGPGLVCKDGLCAGCVHSGECKDASQVCVDAASGDGRCGKCRTGRDCPAGKACLVSGCGDCFVHADCGSGFRCENTVCIAGCVQNGDCAQGEVCAGGQCVTGECVNNQDCAGGKQICIKNACEPCQSSAACGAGNVCDGGACVAGDCVGAADCTGGKLCVANQCTACTSDGQCAPGTICVSGGCVLGDCHADTDCGGATPICRANSCAGCQSRSECGAGKLCDGGSCVPGDCEGSTDCSGGTVCRNRFCSPCQSDLECGASGLLCLQGVCTNAECRLDADCNGRICRANLCVGCSASSECLPGNVCISSGASAGTCTPGDCLTSADCTGGEVCRNNFCAPCSGSSDCALAEVCAQGACKPGNCLTSADCAGGARLCDPTSNQCVPCSTSAQCGAGRVCSAGSCVTGECVTTADCGTSAVNKPGRVCENLQCVSCSADAQCGPGNVCESGSCVPGNCHANGDCSGGKVCTNRFCSPCQDDASCATSGVICVGGACSPGNCHSEADCGGKLCRSSFCTPCAASSECPGGTVCVASGIEAGTCKIGNCNSAAECAAGKLCTDNVCSDCTSDAQCGAGNLCLAGTCKPGTCRTESDCPTGTGGARLCVNNACTACASNAACGTGRVCDGGGCFSGNCVFTSDCESLAPGTVCKSHLCSPCAQDSECGTGRLCLSGQCRPANCRIDTDCPGTQACVDNVCTGNCRTAADCGGGAQLCDPASKFCVPCSNDGQCGSGRICASGSCIAGNCRSDSDCSSGKICKSNYCGSCLQDSECPAGNLCVTGTCKPGNCRSDSECASKLCKNLSCVACVGSVDCGAGRVCSSGTCVTGQCVSNGDCGLVGQPGKICKSFTCVNCGTDSECGSGQVCDAGTCFEGNCRADAECSSTGLCRNHVCTACANSTDCGAGRVCATGACKPGNCLSNLDCQASQTCVNNFCGSCTQDSQCGAGRLCEAAKCVTGNCRTHSDCPSPQACQNLTCTGNCRSDTDCIAPQGCGANFWCQGDCRTSADCGSGLLCKTNVCSACVSDPECGTGKVCDGGLCKSGVCGSSTPCPPGSLCQSNACVQFAPTPLVSTTAKTLETFTPRIVRFAERANRLIFAASYTYTSTVNGVPTAGRHLVGVDPDTNEVAWKAYLGPDGNLGHPMFVLPARGLSPSGEVVAAYSYDGTGGSAGRLRFFDAADGSLQWNGPDNVGTRAESYFYCSKLLPSGEVSWFTNASSGNNVVAHSIGGKPLWTADACSGAQPMRLACGKEGLVVACADSMALLDYSTGGLLSKELYYANTTLQTSPQSWSRPAIRRGPTDTADDILFLANGTSGQLQAVAMRMTVPITRLFTTPVPMPPNFNSYSQPLVDGTGRILGLGTLWSVLAPNGAVQSQSPQNLPINNDSVSMSQSGKLYGTTPTNTVTNPLWTPVPGELVEFTIDATGKPVKSWGYLPKTTVDWFSDGPTLITPAGDLFAWARTTTSSAHHLVRLRPTTPYQPPAAPAWSPAGRLLDGAQCSPTAACVSDTASGAGACGATQGCLLGTCTGSCRTSADCSGADLCQNYVCGPCLSDTACGAGNVCLAGTCQPGCRDDAGCASNQLCFAGSCVAKTVKPCHDVTLDCAPGEACIAGSCVTGPSIRWTSDAIPGSAALHPPIAGADGTIYLPKKTEPRLLALSGSGGSPWSFLSWSSPGTNGLLVTSATSVNVQNMPVLLPGLGGGGADLMIFGSEYESAGSAFSRVQVSASSGVRIGGSDGSSLNDSYLSGIAAGLVGNPLEKGVVGQERAFPGTMVAVSSSGSRLWSRDVSQSSNVCNTPVFGSDGTIYAVCAGGTQTSLVIRALDPKDGAILQTTTLPVGCNDVTDVAMTRPAGASNDLLLVGTRNCRAAYAFDVTSTTAVRRFEHLATTNYAGVTSLLADDQFLYVFKADAMVDFVHLATGKRLGTSALAGNANFQDVSGVLGAGNILYRTVLDGGQATLAAYRYSHIGETLLWKLRVPNGSGGSYQMPYRWVGGVTMTKAGELLVPIDVGGGVTKLIAVAPPAGTTPGLLGGFTWPAYHHDNRGTNNLDAADVQ